ncbi:MAG: DUF3445 domain-containing protein [Tateyamaria sp.]|nr:DUF3445 domain-containing protein [Tateyamaria sp.]
MKPILHCQLPADMRVGRALPGVQPVVDSWLHVDDAYAAQMQRRIQLLGTVPNQVLYLDPSSLPAAQELLKEVLKLLPTLGFEILNTLIVCPDGRRVDVSVFGNPMMVLGQLMQNDFVLMEKRGSEHVLTGAVLCFPASWRLHEKAGRSLTDIHVPVEEYNEEIARRVQRLFDGIKIGRPMWRFNQLWYEDPELFQPRSSSQPRRVGFDQIDGPYYRTERQTLLRLPVSRAVSFAIHTYLLRREDIL